jgi:hypothetical protein
MKKLFFLGVCLVALASQPVMAQTGGSDVDVTVVRITAGGSRTYLAVTRPGGKQEEIELNNYLSLDADKPVGKRKQVGIGLQELVTDLYRQGYQLQSTFDTQTSEASSASVLLFIRKKP